MAADTDKIILMSSTVTFGSTLAYSLMPESKGGKGELPSARLLFGTGLAFVGLSMLGTAAPKLAAGFAVTMATTALMYYGVPIADAWFNPDAKDRIKPGLPRKDTP